MVAHASSAEKLAMAGRRGWNKRTAHGEPVEPFER